MDFGWVIAFAVFWIIVSTIREGTRTVKRPPRRRPKDSAASDRLTDLRDAFAATSPGLRDLLDAIEKAQGARVRPGSAERPQNRPEARRPRVETVDDFTSLESSAEEVVIERVAEREQRREVDLDEESIAIAERRRAWADRRDVPARSRASTESRAPERAAADATAVAVPTPGNPLRQAIIWREILGPPRSLQDD